MVRQPVQKKSKPGKICLSGRNIKIKRQARELKYRDARIDVRKWISSFKQNTKFFYHANFNR